MRQTAAAFTFIETLACLLVLSLGIAAAVSLSYYALFLASTAQGKATGMATALSVAIDPAPLMHQASAAHWHSAGSDGIGTTGGWVNGFYVTRVESLGTQPCVGFTNNPVSVDVYDGLRGRLITSYTTWVMRKAFTP